MKKATLTKLTFLIFVCFLFSIQPLLSDTPQMEYITDGIIKLGINKAWGGGIGYFSRVGADQLNVINHMDRGRNIQQAFYGSKNGIFIGDVEWRFNPVQGGDANGNFSRVMRKINYGDAIYVKTKPLDWAKDNVETPCIMEQWITLRGGVAQIVYYFTYNGTQNHQEWSQEMPAPYFIEYLENLAYYKNGAIRYIYQSEIPINNGVGTGGSNGSLTNGEAWAAYVNTVGEGWGCGVYTPNTYDITYFRSTGGGGSGGFATSYFAPLRWYSLTPGFNVKYTAYLYIANVSDIRSKFNNISQNGLQLAFNGDFEQAAGSNPYSWHPATDAGGSHTYHTSGGQYVYDGNCSVALTAQSSGSWELPYYQQIQEGVTGGTQYKISFRVKCENLYNGTAGIRIIQFNKNGQFLSDSGIMSASEVSGNHSNFQYKDFQFTTHSAAIKIEIRLQLNSLDSWARVWFDSLRFRLKNP